MILDSIVKQTIQAQFQAALSMMEQVITRCPDDLWVAQGAQMPFWHIAYHALFYTHLYLQPKEDDFKAWEKHREEYNFLGPLPWAPHDLPKIGEPYSKTEVLEYLELVRDEVRVEFSLFDLSWESGFSWLPFSKLELVLYTMRHLQQHVGELSGQMGAKAGIEIDWIGTQQN